MKLRTAPARFTLFLAVAAITAALYAGPLTPPAGPVVSTNKPIAEVEPRIAINATNTPGDADSLYKITQPGSYYLTGNIIGVVGKHGIEIAAPGVTLDLMGFDLEGVPAMGAFDGVSARIPSLTNISVLNGSVRNWGNYGVNLGSFGTVNCRVNSVLASGNASTGIYSGYASTVSDCSASGNAGSGIGIFQGSSMTNCSGTANSLSGIYTGTGCTVLNCSATQNTGTGISAEFGCIISNCSAYFNSANGISASTGCTITDCAARSNTLDGIVVTSDCTVRGNSCKSNGLNAGVGAGIHAINSNNRIEGNNCMSSDVGIDIDAAGNMIIRNSCANNSTNFSIAANNIYGPIIDRTAPASAPVTGNAAAGTMGSADPNANYAY